MNFVKNEYEAWNEAIGNTKEYFMLIKSSEDIIIGVDYCACSEEEMKSFIIKEQENKIRKVEYRILKRKAIYSFENDLIDVNNRFKFFAWLKA